MADSAGAFYGALSSFSLYKDGIAQRCAVFQCSTGPNRGPDMDRSDEPNIDLNIDIRVAKGFFNGVDQQVQAQGSMNDRGAKACLFRESWLQMDWIIVRR